MTFYEVNSSYIMQKKPSKKTRWFKDDDSDLFIWEDENNNIESFQFTLEPTIFRDIEAEVIVEWTRKKGLRTGKVNDREAHGIIKGSPVMYMTSNINQEILEMIIEEFLDKCDTLEPKIKDFVLSKLRKEVKE